MQFNPVAIKRRYILGKLAAQCEAINKIPVYIGGQMEAPVGYVDESLGRYADAFVFHMPEDLCKRLATNGYDVSVDYDIHASQDNARHTGRIRLNHIILTSRAAAITIPRRQSYFRHTE